MRADLPWIALYLVTVFMTPLKRYCNGWASRGVRRVVHKRAPSMMWKRLQRVAEVLVCGAVLDFWLDLHVLYFAAITVLFVDDMLNGDDDDRKWQRFKAWAGNKIKWQMALPHPVKR